MIDALNDQFNKVRGALSEYRSKEYSPGKRNPNLLLRSNIRRCLFSAARNLRVHQYDEYLTWLYEQIRKQEPEFYRAPINFEHLDGLVIIDPIPVEQEIEWMAARIRAQRKIISAYRKVAKNIEENVFCGLYGTALQTLQTFSETVGETFWGIQLRFALEQRVNGLEGQKKYYNLIRQQYRRGILAFVSYNFSVANEDRTTIERHRENVRRRISNSKYYTQEVKHYLSYRLLEEWPTSKAGIADVIRNEQNHSIIDIYETFVLLAQEIVKNPEISPSLATPVIQAIHSIRTVDDYRIDRLLTALDPDYSSPHTPPRSNTIANFVIDGNFCAALRELARPDKSIECDPWNIIYASFLLANKKHLRVKPRHAHKLSFDLAKVLRRDDDAIDANASVNKYCANLSGLPFARAILDFQSSLMSEEARDFFAFGKVGINCKFKGPEDCGHSGTTAQIYIQNSQPPISTSETFWVSLSIAVPGAPNLIAFSDRLAVAIRHLRSSNFDQSRLLAQSLYTVAPTYALKKIALQLSLFSAIESGDRAAVIQHIATEGARGPGHQNLLHIPSALRRYNWPDYKPLSKTVYPSIALHLLWKSTEDDAVASLLRFAVRSFFRLNNIEKPSEIHDSADLFGRSDVIYLLRDICIPSIIDMSGLLNGTREVLEERREICSTLSSLDQKNSELYDAEILQITNQIVLTDGLSIVDKNRIYVDTDAITLWARKFIAESFARYRDLVGAGIGVADDYDQVLKDLLSATSAPDQAFAVPDNPADELIVEIYEQLREQFLSDPYHGLDYFLSKRIRHHSFVGLVRGPAEFAHLITTRRSEDEPYQANEYWLSRMCAIDESAAEMLGAAFSNFAKELDRLLQHTKDDLFQIKSASKPEGLFDIQFVSSLFIFARTVGQLDVDLDEFLNSAYQILWAYLGTSLAQAQKHIAEDLSQNVAMTFDTLKVAAKSFAERDPCYVQLVAAISSAATEAQHALAEAAQWFTRPEITLAIRKFSLEQMLTISIESALKSQRAYKPKINKIVKSKIDLPAHDLVFLADVMLVAISNAKAYGTKKNPEISINCWVDTDKKTLCMEIRNPIDEKILNDHYRETLNRIRSYILQGSAGPAPNKEKNSGILKLAAVVQQSSKGEIAFDLIDDREFRLYVQFSLILDKVNPE